MTKNNKGKQAEILHKRYRKRLQSVSTVFAENRNSIKLV